MIIPHKTLKNGFSIPTISLGTWKMGGMLEPDTSNDTHRVDAIKRNIDTGVTWIDTAELYGAGHTDEIIGQAIQGYKRNSIQICSKVKKTNLHYKDIIESAQKGLDRLKTDHYDLYLIHAFNEEIPLEESIEAMNYLVKKGITKYIGVSNFTKEAVAKAQEISEYPIVLNQCHFSVLYREPEVTGLNNYCEENNIIMQAFRPLQFGEIVEEPAKLLCSLAQKYQKTPSQIALNRILNHKNITLVTKMCSLKHIEENLGALGWEMDKQDIELIKREFPGKKDLSDRCRLRGNY